MNPTQWWIFGALCAVLGIIWLGDIFFNAPHLQSRNLRRFCKG